MRVKIQDSRFAEGFRIVDLNRRKAIAERCFNCGGFSYVARKNCEFSECQLWSYRMGLGKCNPEERNRAIRAYCRDYCSEGGEYHVRLCPSPDCPLHAYRLTTIDRSIELI